ncbi:hypothetical protein [Sabulibacter ruber]|uniref:hypothetical protein n=1 Tax=Sabulibacter ruber TaxID=2811901 RepID=UPI001A972A68|nr:hypothetical protein [Sabulibacter ruber]
MEQKDQILFALYARVNQFPEPEDHPTLSFDIARELSLPLDRVLALAQELAQEGFVTISVLSDPPLLYLTVLGVIRCKRLAA